MTNQITQKHLDGLINRLNRITNSPAEYFSVKDGKRVINVGHYHLDGAYGGWKLVRTVNDGGGITCPISSMGYETKRHAYELISAYISGVESTKEH